MSADCVLLVLVEHAEVAAAAAKILIPVVWVWRCQSTILAAELETETS